MNDLYLVYSSRQKGIVMTVRSHEEASCESWQGEAARRPARPLLLDRPTPSSTCLPPRFVCSINSPLTPDTPCPSRRDRLHGPLVILPSRASVSRQSTIAQPLSGAASELLLQLSPSCLHVCQRRGCPAHQPSKVPSPLLDLAFSTDIANTCEPLFVLPRA